MTALRHTLSQLPFATRRAVLAALIALAGVAGVVAITRGGDEETNPLERGAKGGPAIYTSTDQVNRNDPRQVAIAASQAGDLCDFGMGYDLTVGKDGAPLPGTRGQFVAAARRNSDCTERRPRTFEAVLDAPRAGDFQRVLVRPLSGSDREPVHATLVRKQDGWRLDITSVKNLSEEGFTGP